MWRLKKNIGQARDFNSKNDYDSLTKIANELQNPKDINTVFKTAGISEDTAKTVLEKSEWSSKLNDLVKPADHLNFFQSDLNIFFCQPAFTSQLFEYIL